MKTTKQPTKYVLVREKAAPQAPLVERTVERIPSLQEIGESTRALFKDTKPKTTKIARAKIRPGLVCREDGLDDAHAGCMILRRQGEKWFIWDLENGEIHVQDEDMMLAPPAGSILDQCAEMMAVAAAKRPELNRQLVDAPSPVKIHLMLKEFSK